MARQTQKIKVVSYIHVGDRLVNMDTLNEEQHNYVGAILKRDYLNGLFRGKAVFSLPDDFPAKEDVFPELKKN